MKKRKYSISIKLLVMVLLLIATSCFVGLGLLMYSYANSYTNQTFLDSAGITSQFYQDYNDLLSITEEWAYRDLHLQTQEQEPSYLSDWEERDLLKSNFIQRLNDRFGSSNLKFVFASSAGRVVFTNVEEVTKGQRGALETFLARGNNTRLARRDTTEVSIEPDYETYTDTETIRYVLSADLDPNVPFPDVYQHAQKTSDWVNSHVGWLLVFGGLLCILALASIGYLLLGAGLSPSHPTEVRLLWIDKIYSDLFCLAAVLFFMLGTMIFHNTYWQGNYGNLAPPLYWTLLAAVFFVVFAIFLVTLLSIARRVKRRCFWQNALLVRLWKRLRQFVSLCRQNIHVVIKSGLMFLTYSFVNLMMLLAIFQYGRGMDILALLIFNLLSFALVCMMAAQFHILRKGAASFAEGDIHGEIPTKSLFLEFRRMGDDLNKIGDGLTKALEQQMKGERMKTELITNVSHDIKTPLTSIINYIDLLKREKIESPKAQGYLEVLDSKAQRLKILMEDLIEASKVSTGNIVVNSERLCLNELVKQCIGEYSQRFEDKHLIVDFSQVQSPVYILADGRHLWRVIDNLFSNVQKYTMEHTRVYIDLKEVNKRAIFSIKNISKERLNISPDSLMERFVQGDSSRSTEGSGLGLSIARSLVLLQGGILTLGIDGDLFKAVISFPILPPSQSDADADTAADLS